MSMFAESTTNRPLLFLHWLVMLCCLFVICCHHSLLELCGLSETNHALDDITQAWQQYVEIVFLPPTALALWNRSLRLVQKWILISKRTGVYRVVFVVLCLYLWSFLFFLPITAPFYFLWPLFRENIQSSVVMTLPRVTSNLDKYLEVTHGLDEFIDRDSSIPHHPRSQLKHLYENEDATLLCNFDFTFNVDNETVKVDTSWLMKMNDTFYGFTNPETNPKNISEGRIVSGPPLEKDKIGRRIYRVQGMLRFSRFPKKCFDATFVCRATVTVSPTAKHRRIIKPRKLGECSSTVYIYLYDVIQYTVRKARVQHRDLYIPPGGILQSALEYDLLDDDDYYEIIFEHRVNGRLLKRKELSKLDKLKTCRAHFKIFDPFVYLILGSFTTDLNDKGFVQVRDSSAYYGHHRVVDMQSVCVTSDMYGLHTWHARRRVPKPQNSGPAWCVEEDTLVSKAWVAPSFPGLFGNVEAHAQYKFFAECWDNDRQIKSPYCRRRRDRLKDEIEQYIFSEDLMLMIVFLIATIVGTLMTYYYCKSMVYILKLLLRDVVGCAINTLCEVPFIEIIDHRRPQQQQQQYDYDVFLAYAEENDDTARVVTSTMTSSGLRVFDSQRDVAATRQATAVWDEMMGRCSSVVVLASQAYFNDCQLRVQFRALYDCLLHNELSSQRLLMFKVDRCALPSSLGPLPV